jgi:hypothetical protein
VCCDIIVIVAGPRSIVSLPSNSCIETDSPNNDYVQKENIWQL